MSAVEEAAQEIRDIEREINTARYQREQAEKSGDNRAIKQAHKSVRKLEARRMKLFDKVKRARRREN